MLDGEEDHADWLETQLELIAPGGRGPLPGTTNSRLIPSRPFPWPTGRGLLFVHSECEEPRVTTVELPLRPIAAPSRETVQKIARPLLIASAASISAGAIHAGAIGAHAEHPQTAKTFAVVALVQVGWGVLALVRPTRRVALLRCRAERRPVHQLGRRQDERVCRSSTVSVTRKHRSSPTRCVPCWRSSPRSRPPRSRSGSAR